MAVGELLLNVPLPVVVQVPEVALPPMDAAIVAVALEQMVSAGPAVTVGSGLTVIVLVATTAEHVPGALVVNVRVTVPEKFTAGVYVTV